jgi:hypothetical protein
MLVRLSFTRLPSFYFIGYYLIAPVHSFFLCSVCSDFPFVELLVLLYLLYCFSCFVDNQTFGLDCIEKKPLGGGFLTPKQIQQSNIMTIVSAAVYNSSISSWLWRKPLSVNRRIMMNHHGCCCIPQSSSTSSTTTTVTTITTTTPVIIRRTFLAVVEKSKQRRPSVTKSRPQNNRTDVEGSWYTPRQQLQQQYGSSSSSGGNKNLDMGRYGLQRIDYHAIRDHPPVWTLPPHPPTKSISERILFPLTLLIVGGFGLWAYMNPDDEDMRDYWKRVETGQILVEDDDDDDDDDNDDVDEWEDDNDEKA